MLPIGIANAHDKVQEPSGLVMRAVGCAAKHERLHRRLQSPPWRASRTFGLTSSCHGRSWEAVECLVRQVAYPCTVPWPRSAR